MGRMRLTSAEQNMIVDLMAITDRLDMHMRKGSMERRLKMVPRGKWRLAVARAMLLKMSELLLDTVPSAQLEHMRRNLKHVRTWIYIGKYTPKDKDTEEGRFLNINELNIVATTVAEHCKMCDITDKQERRRCKIAKLMDCLPADKTGADDDCGWFDTLGSLL